MEETNNNNPIITVNEINVPAHLYKSLVGVSRIFLPKNPINKVRKGKMTLILVKSTEISGINVKTK